MNPGWTSRKLGEICSIELGKTPARDNPRYWDFGRKTGNVWLSIADLLNAEDGVINDSKEYISDAGAALCKKVRKGTLLVSFKLTLGRMAVAGNDLFTNEAIAALVLRDDAGITQKYLYYALMVFDWEKATDGDQKIKGRTMNKAKLKEIDVAFPDLSEQHRIATILDEAFEGIATAKANAEKNLQNARELFAHHREALLAAQPGWREAPLAELCAIKHGYAFEGEFFSAAGEYVLLTPGSFFEAGGYRERGEKTKYFVGPIPKDYVLSEGDLLVAMTEQAAGLLGSPLLVPDSHRFLHNQRLGLVVGQTGVPWSNEFFFHVFNLMRVRQEIHASASGAKVRHTSPGKIGLVRVAYPESVDEQRRIATQLVELSEECDRLVAVYQRKLAALEELKKSLLHQAYSGQL